MRILIASAVTALVLLVTHSLFFWDFGATNNGGESLLADYPLSGWIALAFWSIGIWVVITLLIAGMAALLRYAGFLKLGVLLIFAALLAITMGTLMNYSPPMLNLWSIVAIAVGAAPFFVVYAILSGIWWWIYKRPTNQ